jgi:hypothetical protein
MTYFFFAYDGRFDKEGSKEATQQKNPKKPLN